MKRNLLASILALTIGFVVPMAGCSSTPAESSSDASASAEESAADTSEASDAAEESASTEESAATTEESAAASEETGEAVELTVFAAASMQETLDEITGLYADVDPNVQIVCNFDSSGTLKTQIEEGAECDVFISAAQKQMDELDSDGLDMIDPRTRVNLLENKVTLVVPVGNPAGITGFEDMAEKLRSEDILIAIGNSDVPVGQYTQKIFEYLGLNEEELAQAGKLTYGTNVKEVTTQVSEGSVACGIIYATDAFSAGLDVVDEATPEMCGQVIYPAAVLKDSKHKADAEAYLAYLQTEPAMQVFESVGFSPVTESAAS